MLFTGEESGRTDWKQQRILEGEWEYRGVPRKASGSLVTKN